MLNLGFVGCSEPLAQYTNTTQSNACIVGGAGSPPSATPAGVKEREAASYCGSANTNVLTVKNCGEEDEITDAKELAGPWLISQRPGNTWASAGTYYEEPCLKTGFKNVQAMKAWHGEYGFLSDDPDTAPLREPSSADGQKYLTYSQDLTVAVSGTGPAPDHTPIHATVHKKRVGSIDRYSGLGSVASGDDCVDEDPVESNDAGMLSLARADRDDTWDHRWMGWILDGDGHHPPILITYANFLDWWHIFTFGYDSFAGVGTYFPGGGRTIEVDSFDESAIHLVDTKLDEDDHLIYTFTLTITDAECSWTWEESGVTRTFVADLSDGYSASDVYGDIVDMLALWDLTDDLTYPWRIDEYVSVAPLVSRHEYPTGRSPLQVFDNDCDWTDPLGSDDFFSYDGSVRGAPVTAGYLGVWDFDHTTWVCCEDGYDLKSWGAISGGSVDPTDGYVPGTASQWTTQDKALSGFYGSWIMIGADTGDGPFSTWGGGVMVAQKWAEILMPAEEDDGEFFFAGWSINYRTSETESGTTLYHLDRSACGPRVMCHSPNGEVFPGGLTIGWPGSPPSDQRFGQRYQWLFTTNPDPDLPEAVGYTCGGSGSLVAINPVAGPWS